MKLQSWDNGQMGEQCFDKLAVGFRCADGSDRLSKASFNQSGSGSFNEDDEEFSVHSVGHYQGQSVNSSEMSKRNPGATFSPSSTSF